jgi:hypothetical protein
MVEQLGFGIWIRSPADPRKAYQLPASIQNRAAPDSAPRTLPPAWFSAASVAGVRNPIAVSYVFRTLAMSCLFSYPRMQSSRYFHASKLGPAWRHFAALAVCFWAYKYQWMAIWMQVTAAGDRRHGAACCAGDLMLSRIEGSSLEQRPPGQPLPQWSGGTGPKQRGAAPCAP